MAAVLHSSDNHQNNLMDLPQELQDIIFGYAYTPHHTPQDPLHFIEPSSWARRQRLLKKGDPMSYTIKPFPAHVVDRFMVSKTYFRNAAEAYISAPNVQHALNQPPSKSLGGIARAFATQYTQRGLYTVSCSTDIPFNLRELTVDLKESDFDDLEPKYLWIDEFSDEELERSACYQAFAPLFRQLKAFELRVRKCRYIKHSWQQMLWDRNLACLEELIRIKVMLPKPAVQASQEPRTTREPLYTGSCVRLGSTVSLPRSYDEEHVSEEESRDEVVSARKRRFNEMEASFARLDYDDKMRLNAAFKEIAPKLIPDSAKLRDDDIPETAPALYRLVSKRGNDFADWVRRAKTSLKHIEEGAVTGVTSEMVKLRLEDE